MPETLDVKQIIKRAKDYMLEVFAEEFHGAPTDRDMRLEEVEHTDSGNWLVTLSLPLKSQTEPSSNRIGKTINPPTLEYGRIIGVDTQRSYKLVELDEQGHVESVRMRPIAVSR